MKKILVVDDDAVLCHLLKVRLEKEGYAVITAEDGNIGLDKANSEKPDLILLDITMKNRDGYSTIKELNKGDITKSIPVIILTATEYMQNLLTVMEGARDYIVKPFDDRDLMTRIARVIGKGK